MSSKHTISVLVENEFGVLARVAGMFAARGYNIDSLSVAPTFDLRYSHITLVTSGNETIIDQILKQLYRLIDTVKVKDLTGENFINRETILLKLEAARANDYEKYLSHYGAETLHQTQKIRIVQYTGDQKQVEEFIELFKSHGILELVRTGTIAMEKVE